MICDAFVKSSYTSDLLNDIQVDADNQNDFKMFNQKGANGEYNSRSVKYFLNIYKYLI